MQIRPQFFLQVHHLGADLPVFTVDGPTAGYMLRRSALRGVTKPDIAFLAAILLERCVVIAMVCSTETSRLFLFLTLVPSGRPVRF